MPTKKVLYLTVAKIGSIGTRVSVRARVNKISVGKIVIGSDRIGSDSDSELRPTDWINSVD